MARSFNGSSQYIDLASALVSAYPFTLAAWANISSLSAGDNTILAISNNAASNFEAQQILIRSSGKLRARSSIAGGTAASAETTATVSTGAWNHFAGVFASSSDRTAYINGTNAVQNTTAISISTLNTTTIGAWANNATRSAYFPGSIAEIGAWNVALDTAEIAALGAGVSPLLIRPGSLVAYLPLIGTASPEINYKGAAFTVSSATKGDHCRIFMPSGHRHIGLGTAGSPPSDPLSDLNGVSFASLSHMNGVALSGVSAINGVSA